MYGGSHRSQGNSPISAKRPMPNKLVPSTVLPGTSRSPPAASGRLQPKQICRPVFVHLAFATDSLRPFDARGHRLPQDATEKRLSPWGQTAEVLDP